MSRWHFALLMTNRHWNRIVKSKGDRVLSRQIAADRAYYLLGTKNCPMLIKEPEPAPCVDCGQPTTQADGQCARCYRLENA